MIVKVINTTKNSEFATYTNVKNISTVGIDIDSGTVIKNVQHSVDNINHKCVLAYKLEFYFDDSFLYFDMSSYSLKVSI